VTRVTTSTPLLWEEAPRPDGMPPPLGRETVTDRVHREVQRAIQWAAHNDPGDPNPPECDGPPRLAVVVIPPGLGKTRAYLETLPRTPVNTGFTSGMDAAGNLTFTTPPGAHRGILPFGCVRAWVYCALSHDDLDERTSEYTTERGVEPFRIEDGLRRYAGGSDAVGKLVDELSAYRKLAWDTKKWKAQLRRRGDLPPSDAARPGEGQPVFAPTSALASKGLLPDVVAVVDEQPPFVETAEISTREIEAWGAPRVDQEYSAWASAHRPAIELVQRTIQRAMEVWAARPPEKRRYPKYFYGPDLESFIRSVGTEADLNAALATVGAHPPEPDLDDVVNGICRAEDYPRFDAPQVIRAVLSPGVPEGSAPLEPADWTGAAIKVWDIGRHTKTGEMRTGAALVVGRRWSSQVEHRAGIVVLDGTGSLLEGAYRAAWPDREVRFFRVEIPPRCPEATTRIHWPTRGLAKSAYLYPTANHKTGREIENAVPLERWLREGLNACERHRTRVGRPLRLGIIAPKRIEEILLAAARLAVPSAKRRDAEEVERDKALLACNVADRLTKRLAFGYECGLIEEVVIRYQMAVRGSNLLEACDALLLLPATPDIGMMEFQAYILGIDGNTYIRDLEVAETLQEMERLRTVRATSDHPKLIFYAGRAWHASWGEHETLPDAPHGGTVPTVEADAVRLAVARCMEEVGCVSSSFVRWLAEAVVQHAALPPELAWAATRSELRYVLKVSDPTIDRAVSREAADAPRVDVSDPTRSTGGRWSWRERRPGGAAAMTAVIRAWTARQPGPNERAAEQRLITSIGRE
jgi:hypothetical protein